MGNSHGQIQAAAVEEGGNARRTLATLAALLGLLMLCAVARAGEPRGRGGRDFSATKGAPVPDNPDADPTEVLVKFKPKRADAAMKDILAVHNIRALAATRFRRIGWHTVRIQRGHKIKDVVMAYRAHPDVLYAEPNYRIHALDIPQYFPNDPRFSELWGMHNTGQTGGTPDADIDAPEAWARPTANDVLIAVIDSGVDYNHEDLAPVMWTNTDEVPGNYTDDDGNGYIDDVLGWDFVGHDVYNPQEDNDPMDDDGHGTHVSGTIAAVGDNSAGVVGVAGLCGHARIMPVRFLDDNGDGTIGGAIDAIEYAIDNGAKVLNNSWGGGGYSQSLKDAITAADAAGALFVAAAGNDYGNDNDGNPHYPSNYDNPNVIAVASTTHADTLSSFSNYGLTSVDLGAPGSSIRSTMPGDSYGFKNGTSMATPHVAGTCALIWSAASPGTTHLSVKDAVLEGVDPIPALAGKCVTGGRLNVNNSFGCHKILSPNGGEGFEAGYSIPVTWQVIGVNWGPGDLVRLDYSANDGTDWNPIPGADALPYDLGTFNWDTTSLPPGSRYLVRVTSVAEPDLGDTGDATFTIAGPLDHFDFVMGSWQPNALAVVGACTLAAKDSAGATIGTFSDFNAVGRFPVTISTPGVTVSGLSGSGDQLGSADFDEGVADLTALGMILTAAAPPQTVQLTAASADAKTGLSNQFLLEQAYTLMVESEPITNVEITGDKPGSTDYAAGCNNHETVNLSAAWEVQGYRFLRWKDTAGATLTYHGTISLVITGNTTVVAEYGLVDDFCVNDLAAEDGIAAGDNANPGTSPEAPMASVQALLNRYPDAGAGCTVYVSDGTYVENISIGASHSGLDLVGAGPGVTTIDGNGSDACLTLEDFADGMITGFTFANGDGYLGGGIDCAKSAPTITNNIIADNASDGAGGIEMWEGSPTVIGNLILANTGDVTGGLSCDSNCASTVANNVIAGNSGYIGGGVICVWDAAPALLNNTITENLAGDEGGGIMCLYADATVNSCIIWANGAPIGPQISLEWESELTVVHSDVTGGEALVEVEPDCTLNWGSGNIDADPFFAAAAGDFHLKSVYGRWDPAAAGGDGGWINDIILSPCIDAGDPTADHTNEPQANGGLLNMGAYGNTLEASKSAFILAVESYPVAGVAISGDKPGVTDYTADCTDRQLVDLAAPISFAVGDTEYAFVRWVIDGVDQTRKQTTVQTTVAADSLARAHYNLVGDVNGDCEVDVLDLIAIRNHLYEDVATEHNWRYDITGDGEISVLDLIAVRNQLYTVCGQ